MKFISYHGTTSKSLENILKEGFKPFYGSRYGKTFGKGIYTSKNPEEAVMYSEGCNKILICEIDTDNYKKINICHFIKKHTYDLIIIGDGIEYLVTNISKIKVIGVAEFNYEIIDQLGVKYYKNIEIMNKEYF